MTLISPGSPEWLRLITPSKVPAILGVSRWQSQYALWHEMTGRIERPALSAAKEDDFDYGHAAEHAAAAYWKFKNRGWRLSPGEVQYTNSELPFPNLATLDRRASRGRARRVVEIKTARSLEEWGDDGTGETPIDYTAQVITQQLITGWHAPADLVLWPQYGKPRIYRIDFDQEIADTIIAACTAWMTSIASGTPPPLDDSVTTYETVRALHPDIDDTETILDTDLAVDYLTADADLRALTKHHRGLKTAVLDSMGRAKTATAGGVKVADRRAAKYGVSLYPSTKNLDHLKELA